MTAQNQQIVTAFEDAGMTPEQISEDTGFELAAIKAILIQCSSKFRKDAKKDGNLQFTDNEAEEMMVIIKDIARYAENEGVRLKAAVYVVDDKKGRLDIARDVSKFNFNIINFNDQMKKALRAEQRTLELKDAVTV